MKIICIGCGKFKEISPEIIEVIFDSAMDSCMDDAYEYVTTFTCEDCIYAARQKQLENFLNKIGLQTLSKGY